GTGLSAGAGKIACGECDPGSSKYITSISQKETIKKAQVANLIKNAAKNMGLSQKDYSCHWLRTGGVCALLAAGKSDLVIRLMGRWSSWCFSVYATWNDTRRGK
ncbi:hypothetical protein JG687_00014736, partial [Phytophthora cactorum]